MTTSFVVIPARLASTRLPRKLLLRETGKPLIQHTYEAARRATRPAGICVACDHRELFDAVRAFGGRAVMTDPEHASGTDRVAEVARAMPEVDILVNVQGDEPEIAGGSIDLAISLLDEKPRRGDVDAGHADPQPGPTRRPGVRQSGLRRPPPGPLLQPQRDPAPPAMGRCPAGGRSAELLSARRAVCLSAEFLLRLAEMPQAPLEKVEKLEQLRVLHAGHAILVGVVDEPTFGIDTPADYRAFVEKQRSGG